MQTIRQQLNRLRWRETALDATWGAARGLAVLLVVLAGACLTDWLIDLRRDTPFALRVALLVVQVFVWFGAAVFLTALLFRRPGDAEVALWVENKVPDLGHLLISAVQLNRPGAANAGMSPELIAVVTRDAEARAASLSFARLADGRRLVWSLGLLAPLLLVAGVLFLLWPPTVRALLSRQFLSDVSIPRSLTLASVEPEQVCPVGEPVLVRFHVAGDAVRDDFRGEVRVDPDDGPSERYELTFEAWHGDGEAIYVARVPAGSADFACHAWLKDARSHQPGLVHFEPRPVVQKQEAWVRLPARVSLRPADQPYEEPQKNGDIVRRFPGCSARLVVEVQKPIQQATIEILGPVHALTAVAASPQPSGEAVRRTIALRVREDGRSAEGLFTLDAALRPEFVGTLAATSDAGLPWAALVLSSGASQLPPESGYRVVVQDRFGLANTDPPRRSIQSAAVEPPEVALLPEYFWKEGDAGAPEEREVEGIPALLGQRVRLEYECAAPYGLDRARLRYRVIKKGMARDEGAAPNEEDFLPLPLGGRVSDEFSTVPAAGPGELAGTRGGGRYDFDTNGVPDGKGGLLLLEPGDRLQFFVEVFGRADPEGQPGRSTLREKEVVALKDFLAWLERKDDQKERIRQLEEKQRGRSGSTVADKMPPPPRDDPIPTPPRPPQRPETPPTGEPVFGRSWQLLGVLPSPNDTGHAQVYPPETELVDLGKDYTGLKGAVRWQTYQSPGDLIDLKKFFQHGEAGVAYAVCWVQTGRRSALLATGSDDGIKVWINRGLVLDKAVHRPAIPGEDRTPVELSDGWNEILVKVDNRFDTWGFYLELRDPGTGRPLDRVPVRLTPPPEEGRKFVRQWQLIGPFRLPGNDGRTHAYPPESEKVKLDKEYDGRYGKVRWKQHQGGADRIDVLRALDLSADRSVGIAYAVCWVKSESKRPALVVIETDSGIRVWVNRQQVLDRPGSKADEPGSDRAAVELTRGWNEVLVKVDNPFGKWFFALELRDPVTGRPLDKVEYRVTPP